jgi:hypothetical protein
VRCLRDRFRTLLPVCIDGTLLNNSDNVRTKLGSDIVIGTSESNGLVWGWDLWIDLTHKLPADSCGAASMNKQASTQLAIPSLHVRTKRAFPHSLQPNSNRSWRKECVESSTVRAPQPEAHSDLRRKPRQVSQVNRSPDRNRSPRN